MEVRSSFSARNHLRVMDCESFLQKSMRLKERDYNSLELGAMLLRRRLRPRLDQVQPLFAGPRRPQPCYGNATTVGRVSPTNLQWRASKGYCVSLVVINLTRQVERSSCLVRGSMKRSCRLGRNNSESVGETTKSSSDGMVHITRSPQILRWPCSFGVTVRVHSNLCRIGGR